MPARHHVHQSEAATCVAACVCIVESHRGRPIQENELLVEWEPWRLPNRTFDWAPVEERFGTKKRWNNPDTAGYLSFMRALLVDDAWAIAWVLRDYYAPIWQSRGLTSQYGSPTTFHHSVVVCATEPFSILDPFFERTNQPIQLSDAEVLRCFSGDLLVAPR